MNFNSLIFIGMRLPWNHGKARKQRPINEEGREDSGMPARRIARCELQGHHGRRPQARVGWNSEAAYEVAARHEDVFEGISSAML
jgi:hypothetical protein